MPGTLKNSSSVCVAVANRSRDFVHFEIAVLYHCVVIYISRASLSSYMLEDVFVSLLYLLHINTSRSLTYHFCDIHNTHVLRNAIPGTSIVVSTWSGRPAKPAWPEHPK